MVGRQRWRRVSPLRCLPAATSCSRCHLLCKVGLFRPPRFRMVWPASWWRQTGRLTTTFCWLGVKNERRGDDCRDHGVRQGSQAADGEKGVLGPGSPGSSGRLAVRRLSAGGAGRGASPTSRPDSPATHPRSEVSRHQDLGSVSTGMRWRLSLVPRFQSWQGARHWPLPMT